LSGELQYDIEAALWDEKHVNVAFFVKIEMPIIPEV